MGRTVKIPTGLWRGFLDADKRKDTINGIVCYALFKSFQAIGDVQKALDYLGIHGAKEGMALLAIQSGETIEQGVSTKSFYYVDIAKLQEFGKSGKGDREALLLVMYYALGSMQGIRSYFKTNNNALLSRMSGHDKSVDESMLPPMLRGMSKYQMRKLRSLMYDYYKVSFYTPSHCRGFYFSTKLDLKELIKSVEQPKDSRKSSLAADTQRILEEIRAGQNFSP